MPASRAGANLAGAGASSDLSISLPSELRDLLQETPPPLGRILGLTVLTEPAPLPTLQATAQPPIPQPEFG